MCLNWSEKVFVGSLREQDWARFHTLAPRIKIANRGRRSTLAGLGKTILTELVNPNPKPPPLLPNVRELDWETEDVDVDAPLIPMGPSLRRLRASVTRDDWSEDDSPSAHRFFSRMAMLCANLTSMDLLFAGMDRDSGQETVNALAKALQQLQALQTVRIDMSDASELAPLVVALSALPDLREVELICSDNTFATWISFGSRSNLFPSLTDLTLGGWGNIAGVTALLEDMAERQIKSDYIGIREGDSSGTVDIGAVLRSLGGYKGRRHINILTRAHVTLSLQLLAPIGILASLEALELYAGGPFAMTDGDLASLVSGLSKLRILNLGSEIDHVTLTLDVLRVITTSCPLIEVIKISVLDALNPDPEPAFLASRTLRSLFVGRSPIEDIKAVALFLGTLSDVGTFEVYYERLHWWEVQILRWREVAEWIPVLRKARHSDKERVLASSRA